MSTPAAARRPLAAALGRGAGPAGARPGRRALWVAAAAVLLVAALTLGVLVGPAGLTPRAVLLELWGAATGSRGDSGLSAQQQAILWQIRLPRVVLGAVVGAMLALAGAAYQGVFRNPLADPYLLGVSSGAGLGATLAIVAGGAIGGLGLPVVAFIGGLLGVGATYALGSSVGGGVRSPVVVVLAGVAVAAFLNAVQTFVQQRYDDTLRSVYSWLLGRLSTQGWSEVVTVLPYVVVAAVVVLLHRRVLDVMAVGDTEARSLGVDTGRTRLVLVVAATLGTAAVVSVSGLIGFVGIVVPHAVRLVLGASHRTLLPVSMLVGAAFLVAADVLARTAMSPAELPIGVVTALVGAPFFVLVLRRARLR
ncbi:FecCD family ABC transporter permease [Aquipuribacter nitratireducens]|uniref:FecCD family ABC transporter permease n=1 Tax=Aquipuribacter nitratireducens TaxID=650104 RepID=A0ABW0GLE8_9MICO